MTRERDTAIARTLGWTQHDDVWWWMPGNKHSSLLKSWSTDDSAAVELLGEIRKRFLLWQVMTYNSFIRCTIHLPSLNDVYADGQTFAEAVSGAFLKAMENP